MKATYLSHSLSDTDIANFARQSFNKRAEQYSDEQNANLIRYLARGMTSQEWNALADKLDIGVGSIQEAKELATYIRNIPEHWVPFGHPHITLRVSAPVPIRTQCFKHKIGFVESEESRRYIKSRPELYVPEHFRVAAENVKQGSAGIHPDSAIWLDSYEAIGNTCIKAYENMLAAGICPEQARFILPQGCEVNWVWTGSLYAFAQAYIKRSDAHAQQEVQTLFAEIDKIISPLYPVAWAALTQGEY